MPGDYQSGPIVYWIAQAVADTIGLMIAHTMLVSFADPIPAVHLDQFLADIELAVSNTGVVRASSAQHHIPVPGEDQIPAFIATAVLQFVVENRDDLAKLFAAPDAAKVIHTWQARNPYRVAWVNHEVQAGDVTPSLIES